MTKIIFLDFDGVLNAYTTYQEVEGEQGVLIKEQLMLKRKAKNFIWDNSKEISETKFWKLLDLDYDKVRLLNKLISQTDAKIVFSTSWRGDGTLNLALYLTILGFLYPDHCIDCTPYVEGIRGKEIQQWLDNNNGCDKYAILDDEMFDIKDYHPERVIFQTNMRFGLTEDIVDRVIEWLNKEDD